MVLALLAGCAERGTKTPIVNWGSPVACSDDVLAMKQYGIEVVPAAGSGYPAQEFSSLKWDNCVAVVRLSRGAVLSGAVGPAAAAGTARVIATRPSALTGGNPVNGLTVADSNGNFSLTIAPGQYRIRAFPTGDAAAGYPPATSQLSVMPGTPTVKAALVLARGRHLTGALTTAAGTPRTGVQVRAVDPKTLNPISSVMTTRDAATGDYDIYLNTDDPPSIQIVATGGSPPIALTRNVMLQSLDSTPELTTLKAPAIPSQVEFKVPIKGISLSGAMVPVPGAQVEFLTYLPWETSSVASFSASTVTDAEGIATSPLLPGADTNRSYAVTVTPPSTSPWAGQIFDAALGSTAGYTAPLVLGVRPSVVGQLVGPQGSPIGGAIVAPVYSIFATTPASLAPNPLPQILADGEGRFITYVERALYDLEITPPPGVPLGPWSLDKTDVKSNVALDQVQLPPAIQAKITVLGANGQPLSGVTTRLYLQQSQKPCSNADGCPLAARLRGEGSSGADGNIALYIAAF